MKHKCFGKYLVALVFVLIFGVCSVVSDTTFADEPGSARFQVEVLPSLSVSVSDVSIEAGNGVSTGTATISISSNNQTGYTTNVTTNYDSTESNATDLKHVTTGDTIPSLLQPVAKIAFPANAWGISLDDETYSPVPAKDVAPFAATTLSRDMPGDVSGNIYFGVKVDNATTSGVYRNSMLVTVIANPLPTKSVTYKSDVVFTSLAAGSTHSLAIDSTGHLWAWGENSYYGQLGDGTTIDRPTPIAIKPDTTFISIAAGHMHSLALDSTGHLWAWGENINGRLGDGTTTYRSTPVAIKPDTTFVAIAAGLAHSLAIDSAGHLWAWGYNSYGQLGDGTNISRNIPVMIKPDTTFTAITAGHACSLAIDSDGHLWAWGYNYGQLGDGTRTSRSTPVAVKPDTTFATVKTSYNHSVALDSTGHLWAWGSGIVNGSSMSSVTVPQAIKPDTTFITIDIGQEHSLALDSTGHLWAWGRNGCGQLGDGTTAYRFTPVAIKSDTTFVAIAAGLNHSLAIDSAGHFWAWGGNYLGQLGNGLTADRHIPVVIKPDVTFAFAVAGFSHSLALDATGHLWTWGDNTYGQLGNGDSGIYANQDAPVAIKEDTVFTTIAAGSYHSLAIDSDVYLWVWGGNDYGQLGNGTSDYDGHPTPMVIKGDTTFIDVAAGSYHSLAIDSDGHLWVWGKNDCGQLGNGTSDYDEHPTPMVIKGDTTFIDVAAGESYSFALDSGGHLWAWGYNSYGQLGDGTDIMRTIPVAIKPNTTFTSIAAGGYHSLALDSTGHLWAWGRNSYGQLGDGTDISRNIPVMIKPDTTFATIAAGSYHSFAVDSDGHLWAWGYNSYGQLGDGTSGYYADKYTPVVIKEDTVFISIVAGDGHSLAVDSDGHLWTWGSNSSGQLGYGSNDVWSPSDILIYDYMSITMDSSTILSCADPLVNIINPDKTFKEWNTSPDGTGAAYHPGDIVTTDGIILYAIWE